MSAFSCGPERDHHVVLSGGITCQCGAKVKPAESDPPTFAAGDVVLLERSSAGEAQPLRRSQRWRRGVVLCGTARLAVQLTDEHGSIVNVAPTALVRRHPIGAKMRVRAGSAFSLGGQQVVTIGGDCCAPEDNPSPVGLYHVAGYHYGCGYAYHDELEPAAPERCVQIGDRLRRWMLGDVVDGVRVARDPSYADGRPPWADWEMPDIDTFMSSEAFVAGALSTMPFAANYHPGWCLPIARQALDALSEWEPDDAASDPGEQP